MNVGTKASSVYRRTEFSDFANHPNNVFGKKKIPGQALHSLSIPSSASVPQSLSFVTLMFVKRIDPTLFRMSLNMGLFEVFTQLISSYLLWA